MFQINGPTHAPANVAGFPAHMGAMAPYTDIVGQRRYDIVGVDDPNAQGTWDKIKVWGDKKTFGVANKWLTLGAVIVAGAWYGYYAGWFR